MRQEDKAFVNPTGYWEYTGDFTVELISDADKSIVPGSVHFEGDIAHITQGRIKQTVGGIQLKDEGENPFYWGYAFIICLRKPDGSLIWKNRKY